MISLVLGRTIFNSSCNSFPASVMIIMLSSYTSTIGSLSISVKYFCCFNDYGYHLIISSREEFRGRRAPFLYTLIVYWCGLIKPLVCSFRPETITRLIKKCGTFFCFNVVTIVSCVSPSKALCRAGALSYVLLPFLH